ncbi:Uncharacterized protein GBIM_13765 [Gryllus bimaculatus]|nr:Uncharacterized protein GBIM_13765 [Gryllus bimaculatus]
MCDLFSTNDARLVFENKKILFLGDSNVRSFYKDLVFLLENNRLLSEKSLKNKKKNVHIKYHFLTKCFTEGVRELFLSFKNKKSYPDIIIMNSCLWDICRWGPNGVLNYKDNMVKLMKLVKSCLPDETLFIWTCVPPISNHCSGGLLVKQVQFLEHSLRFDVMEGNMFAREVVVSHGFDVLDIHYYLRMQLHWRARDGVHWLPHAVRHVTNLILTHICVAFNIKLPGNIKDESVERFKGSVIELKSTALKVDLPKAPSVKSVAIKVSKGKPYPIKRDQISRFIEQEKVMLSPLRKTIKDKIKYSKRYTDEYSEGDLSNLSLISDESNNSFCLDISLEASAQNQYQGLGINFESTSYDIDSIMNSPIPNFIDNERHDLKGPIRFRAMDRRSRTHRVPYMYR